MEIKFVSDNPRIQGFIDMARLLDTLQPENAESVKVSAIENALKNGVIKLEDAMNLYDEFIYERR